MAHPFFTNTLFVINEIARGWLSLGNRIVGHMLGFLKTLNLYQGLFLISCLGLMVTAAPHWMEYEVEFLEKKIITIGSDSRIYFFLTGFLGIFLNLFSFKYNQEIFFGIVGSCIIAYILGFVFPYSIHTHMKNSSDFIFRFTWAYLYGFFLLLTLASSFQAFSISLLTPEKIKNYFLANERYKNDFFQVKGYERHR